MNKFKTILAAAFASLALGSVAPAAAVTQDTAAAVTQDAAAAVTQDAAATVTQDAGEVSAGAGVLARGKRVTLRILRETIRRQGSSVFYNFQVSVNRGRRGLIPVDGAQVLLRARISGQPWPPLGSGPGSRSSNGGIANLGGLQAFPRGSLVEFEVRVRRQSANGISLRRRVITFTRRMP